MIKKIYPSINGLRAISILLVIIYHLALIHKIQTSLGHNFFSMAILKFITDGQLGVNVFFLLSGFLITSLLLWEEGEEKIFH